MTRWRNDCRYDFQTEFVIIDCLGRVFTKNEKDEEEIKAFITGLERCCRNSPCIKTVLLLHHTTKLQGKEIPSLLHNPEIYINNIRGNGRLLDFMPMRLAIAEEGSKVGQDDVDKHFYVVHGVCRNGVTPLILSHDSEVLRFDVHADDEFIVEQLFERAEKQKTLYRRLKQDFPNGFTFSQIEAIKGADLLQGNHQADSQ